MMGAIAGDIVGSVFEDPASAIKSKEFPLFSENSRFTDDTVLTVAVADSLLTGAPFAKVLCRYVRAYPDAGFSPGVIHWASLEKPGLRDSYGNGSAMRVSSVGWWFDSPKEVCRQARLSALPTHAHEEAIKGAQAIALAILMARMGQGKKHIRDVAEKEFGYDLGQSLAVIRPDYGFEISCQKSVPQALVCFLESSDYEDAVRNAVSLGGDSDTLACMAGAVAEAYYGQVPDHIARQAMARLDEKLKKVIIRFIDALEDR